MLRGRGPKEKPPATQKSGIHSLQVVDPSIVVCVLGVTVLGNGDGPVGAQDSNIVRAGNGALERPRESPRTAKKVEGSGFTIRLCSAALSQAR